ncbi:MAG: hypothetical protein K8S97_07730, partial [Anaerolineae bacterium]|nr:hypothetical protein [Anaerolineae bacterium]
MSGELPQEPPIEHEPPESEVLDHDTADTVDLENKHTSADQPVTKQVDRPTTEPKRRWGSLLSSARAHLLLHVQGAGKPLRVEVCERVVVGRAHAPTECIPDIDLEPYGAHRKGVSRQHIAITFCDHMLQ